MTRHVASVSTTSAARNRALRMPIVLLEAYLILTALIFFFGPVEWKVPSPAKLVVFLAVNFAALWVGYSWGIRRGRRTLRHAAADFMPRVRVPQWVLRLVLFSMVFSIFSCLVRLYSIRGSLDAVLETIVRPGEAYRQAQMIAKMYREGDIQVQRLAWAFRITTLLSVFNGLYFPLALACWGQLRPAIKGLFFVALAVTFTYTMGIGAQSGIGFLVFAALPSLLYKVYVSGKSLAGSVPEVEVERPPRRSSSFKVRLLIAAAVIAVVGTVVFFQIDRVEASGRDFNPGLLAGEFGSASETGVLASTGRVGFGFSMLAQYVSHGYEGLALSMELPFEWTYGIGWSKALQVIYHQYLGGPDLFERSYLFRNEAATGWPALQFWSTIFPWIASDTTYFGTFLPMLLVGFILGRSWGRVIVTGNPIGFALLAQLFTLVLMFPANNALAQTLEGLFALIGVTWIYVFSIRYFNRQQRREWWLWHSAPMANAESRFELGASPRLG